jgi:hypothetical protein
MSESTNKPASEPTAKKGLVGNIKSHIACIAQSTGGARAAGLVAMAALYLFEVALAFIGYVPDVAAIVFLAAWSVIGSLSVGGLGPLEDLCRGSVMPGSGMAFLLVKLLVGACVSLFVVPLQVGAWVAGFVDSCTKSAGGRG